MTAGPRRGWGRALLAASLSALAACRGGPVRQSVDRIVVAETDAALRLETVGVSRDEVLRAAAEALRASPQFGPPAAEGEAARHWLGRVALHRVETLQGGGPPLAQVTLTLELSPQGEGTALRETARAGQPVGPGPRDLRDAFARATGTALARAVGGFGLLLLAERKADSDLIADLRAADARTRDVAIRVLADRRQAAAVPALVERLADPDADVVERAIGALGQIGDPRAVTPLVRLAQRRQGPSVAHLARIIGDIGGPDARAYLLTLSSGHGDRLVQAAAQQALDEMTAREVEARAGARR